MNRRWVFVTAVLIASCIRDDPAGAPRVRDHASASLPEKARPAEPIHDGKAQLTPTQGSNVSGSLVLDSSPHGVRISGAVQGLKPDAQFGFHIHEFGDCSAPDASSAGDHFDPDGRPHGDPSRENRHAGDMVNIRSNREGVAQVDTTVRNVSINSGRPDDVLNKEIIVHASRDDRTQPSGGSGEPLACALIAAVSSSELPQSP